MDHQFEKPLNQMNREQLDKLVEDIKNITDNASKDDLIKNITIAYVEFLEGYATKIFMYDPLNNKDLAESRRRFVLEESNRLARYYSLYICGALAANDPLHLSDKEVLLLKDCEKLFKNLKDASSITSYSHYYENVKQALMKQLNIHDKKQ